MTYKTKNQACTSDTYEVSRTDLPLSCPMPGMRLYDAHPKVFLPIEEIGKATCPYCGANFTLKD